MIAPSFHNLSMLVKKYNKACNDKFGCLAGKVIEPGRTKYVTGIRESKKRELGKVNKEITKNRNLFDR